jgi:phage shock protein PspC (stress-responsive transcriptional regulator)
MSEQGPSASPVPPSTTPPTASPAPGDFFDRVRGFGAVRPDEGRWAAGVAAGLARRWSVDPLLVRGGFVALTLLSGFGLAAYGLCWLFLPQADGRIHAQEVLRGRVTAGFVGGAVLVLLDLPRAGWWGFGWGWGGDAGPSFGGLVVLALVGLGVWWAVQHRRPGGAPPAGSGPGGGSGPAATTTALESGPAATFTPAVAEPGGDTPGHVDEPTFSSAYATQPTPATGPDPEAPSGVLTRITLGVALIAGATLLLWDRFGGGLPDDVGTLGLVGCVALGIVALGIVASGLLGRRPGGLAPVAVVLAFVAVSGALVRGPWSGVGNREWRPTTAAAAEQKFDHGIGEANLDLRAASVTAGATAADPVRVPAHLGIGRLTVVVPASTAVEVRAKVGIGAVTDDTTGGSVAGGDRDTVITVGSGNPVMVVEAEVGIGNVDVETGGAA